jgi:hypothetical protein
MQGQNIRMKRKNLKKSILNKRIKWKLRIPLEEGKLP